MTHPTPLQFSEYCIGTLRGLGISDPVSYDPETFSIRVTSVADPDSPLVWFLERTYRSYLDAVPDQRLSVLRDFALAAIEARHSCAPSFAGLRDRLLPVIADPDGIGIMNLSGDVAAAEAKHPACAATVVERPINALLSETIAVDSDKSRRFLMSTDLALPGAVPADQAYVLARTNLEGRPDCQFRPTESGLFYSSVRDYYDTSRILFGDRLITAPLRRQIRGRPVALALQSETLLLTGSDNPQGLCAMAQFAFKIQSEGHRTVTSGPVVLEDSRWVPFIGGPAEFRLYALRHRASHYNQQKTLLDRLHAANGENVFVSSIAHLRVPTGELHDFCVWPLIAGPSLLPVTDLIAFAQDAISSPIIVRREVVEDILGDAMQRGIGRPVRVRVERFPSPSELTQLKRFAIDA